MGFEYDYAFLGQRGREIYFYDYERNCIDRMEPTHGERDNKDWFNNEPFQYKIDRGNPESKIMIQVEQNRARLTEWSQGVLAGHGVGIVVGRYEDGNYLIVFNSNGNIGMNPVHPLDIEKFGIKLINGKITKKLGDNKNIKITTHDKKQIPVIKNTSRGW